MKGKVLIIGVAILVILGLVVVFVFGTRRTEKILAGELTFVGVFDSPSNMNSLISAYTRINSEVDIQYIELNPSTYESELLNALAGTNPPDLFMVHNTWLPKHFDKIAPFSQNQIAVSDFRALFPSVAEQDFAPDQFVYALPLYIDTLAMYYNQDTFDNAGIALPPETWAEVGAIIPKLREVDSTGRINKAGAAIGGSNKSINRATDILNLVMLQAGTRMVSEDYTSATFASDPPGLSALEFYTKFANPIDPAYTWNDSLANSIDSFAAGDTAIMFNYSHQAPFLKEKNPFLNFRIVAMPQPQDATQDLNYANYWGVAAAAQGRNRVVAQDFILFAAANPNNSLLYLNATNRPPALRGLINQYLNSPELGIFARQALTARSWPQPDNTQVESIFSEMIQDIIGGQQSAQRALQEAEAAVTDLINRRNR